MDNEMKLVIAAGTIMAHRATINDLVSRCKVLEAQNAKLLALLQEMLEDPPLDLGDGTLPVCPFCQQQWGMSHADDCWLVRVEKATGAKGETE